MEITPAHLFFVVTSDGVFEFLSSQEVVNMVMIFPLFNFLAPLRLLS